MYCAVMQRVTPHNSRVQSLRKLLLYTYTNNTIIIKL